MVDIAVNTKARLIRVAGVDYPCMIGRDGACPAADKREGDGRTPCGTWPIRAALLRPGAGFAPPAGLPWRWLRPQDGWSDDPVRADYNQPVSHPYPGSAERLWRADGVYDAVLVLGYNDDPARAGRGSAIFLHLAGERSTEGCVAVKRDTMRALLGLLRRGDNLVILPECV